MRTVGTVSRIFRYPVKSMGGVELTSADVDADGIVGDRGWALRDVETGKLVSAKRPRPWRTLLDVPADGEGDDVVVTLPDDRRYGITDADLPAALSALLGREVTVEKATHPQQGVYASDWPHIEGLALSGEVDLPTNLASAGSTFVDLAVLHLLTTASLATLAEVAPDLTVDVRRFRPSVVIDTPGETGWAENEWEGSTLRLGEVTLSVGMPTPRCIMTTLDQGDLPREPEVLQALAEHNRREFPVGGTFACLGSYADVVTGGTIAVGDEVVLGS